MSSCRICTWVCRRFLRDASGSFWREVSDWDRVHSNEHDLWSSDPAAVQSLNEAGLALRETDPEAAFRLFCEAADAGSAWAMEAVGWYHETHGPIAERFGKAQEYYHRAISAGSWLATLRYARLLAMHGYPDHCDRTLEDGVRADFIPSWFRLAWYRYERSPKRATAREIRPLLEYAAGQGHPGAQRMLAALMLRGAFGLREIPEGARRIWKGVTKSDASAAVSLGETGLQVATQ